MTTPSPQRLVKQLSRLKRSFDARSADRLLTLLTVGPQVKFRDAEVLAHYHETVLFIRAHPFDPRIVKAAEQALKAIPREAARLSAAGANVSALDEADLSGVAGRSVNGVFSFPVARWLAREHPREIEIDWEGYEDEARLAQVLSRLIPLLEDETLVEAHFPYREWLRGAAGEPKGALSWLTDRIDALPLAFPEKATLYDALKLYVTYTPAKYQLSRTGMRIRAARTFYHQGPMLSRRDVSLEKEMSTAPPAARPVSPKEGAALLESILQTSAQRYRELHGFSYADPASFIHYDAGRGIDIYVNEVTPDHRLPFRAYHSAFMVKNGVPAGYVEGLSLFDRMELGFNIYYTFRDGESAYLYAKVMQIFHQSLGINCFSVDPYQIGHENEEGLASGAFWFYRKLGFQPARADLVKLVQREEKKIAANATYRTSIDVLKQIAEGPAYFDRAERKVRDWSKFHVRNLGLAAAREMKREFRGDATAFRVAAEQSVAASLDIIPRRWPALEQKAFSNWATVLYLIRELPDWTNAEKKLATTIVRTKGSDTEARYLRTMQAHPRLRDAILRLGIRS